MGTKKVNQDRFPVPEKYGRIRTREILIPPFLWKRRARERGDRVEWFGNPLFEILYPLAVGVIGFFLVRSFNRLDKCVSKEEAEVLRTEIGRLSGDIAAIKEGYITKEDFFREQAKTDKKLDRIMEILMELQKGRC